MAAGGGRQNKRAASQDSGRQAIMPAATRSAAGGAAFGDPPRLAALHYKAHLQTILDSAKANALDERVALLSALVDAPIRRRSLFESVTHMKRLRSASIEELELHLRAEFCEWIADVVLATSQGASRKLMEARARGGASRAAQKAMQAALKFDRVAKEEARLIASGAKPREINKLIARSVGITNIDYVRKVRKKLKAALS